MGLLKPSGLSVAMDSGLDGSRRPARSVSEAARILKTTDWIIRKVLR